MDRRIAAFGGFRDDRRCERADMHILITGAAGMVGRKLTERLVTDGGLNGKPIDRLTLVDVVAPAKPAGFAGKVDAYALDVSGEDAGRKLVNGSSRRDLPSRRGGVGRGRDRLREGLPHQPGRHALPARGDPLRRRISSEAGVHVVDRGVRRAVPERDLRRVPSHAAHLLRHAEGHLRAAARRLHPQGLSRRRRHPPADHLRAAGHAEQGGVGLLLQHHPRAARRQGSGAAGRGDA